VQKDGQQKGQRFAAARLSDSNGIVTSHDQGPQLALDRRRFGETLLGDFGDNLS